MNDLIAWFENLAPPMRLGFFFTGMFFFYILEGKIPFKAFQRGSRKNLSTNLKLTALGIVVNIALATGLIAAGSFATTYEYGMWHFIDIPIVVKVLFAFLLLDFFDVYIPHVLMHKVPILWRVHTVHHSDPELGVTSALRQHPLQPMIQLPFAMGAIVIAGAPIGAVLLYYTVRAVLGQMSHANIKLPFKIEKPLSYIFSTPRFHKLHHHYLMPTTDSNYGGIFSIYDHLFRTATPIEKADTVKFGVDTFIDEKRPNTFWALLAYPFKIRRN